MDGKGQGGQDEPSVDQLIAKIRRKVGQVVDGDLALRSQVVGPGHDSTFDRREQSTRYVVDVNELPDRLIEV